jgi:hypothetical protein
LGDPLGNRRPLQPESKESHPGKKAALHETITPKEWVAIALACAAIGLFAV